MPAATVEGVSTTPAAAAAPPPPPLLSLPPLLPPPAAAAAALAAAAELDAEARAEQLRLEQARAAPHSRRDLVPISPPTSQSLAQTLRTVSPTALARRRCGGSASSTWASRYAHPLRRDPSDE